MFQAKCILKNLSKNSFHFFRLSFFFFAVITFLPANLYPRDESERGKYIGFLEKFSGTGNNDKLQKYIYLNKKKIQHRSNAFDEIEKLKQFSKAQTNTQSGKKWKSIGPFSGSEIRPERNGLGRVNCVAFHPEKDEIWIGAATGGAYKSTDRGANWLPIEFGDLPVIGVSDIEFTGDHIFILTGDAEAWVPESGFNFGLIYSMDEGESWERISLTGTEKGLILSDLIISNSGAILIATEDGIYYSKDLGKSWDTKFEEYYFRNLISHPKNKDTIFASTTDIDGNSRLFRSKDGGKSWEELKRFPGGIRIEMAVNNYVPDKLWVLYANSLFEADGTVLMTPDGGESWHTILHEDERIVKGAGHYNLAIEAIPMWENGDLKVDIYAAGINISCIKNKVDVIDISKGVHVDHHKLKRSPYDSLLYSCNDGGIFRYNPETKIWEDLSKGLAITQFYRLGANPVHESLLFGGAQDNGTLRMKLRDWSEVGGADGMECIVHPKNPQIVYSSIQRGEIFKSTDGGKYFDKHISHKISELKPWIADFLVLPGERDTIIVGYQNLWMITDDGETVEKLTDITSSYEFIKDVEIPDNSPGRILFAKGINVYSIDLKTKDFESKFFHTGIVSDIVSDGESGFFVTTIDDFKPRVLHIAEKNKDLTANMPELSVYSLEYIVEADRLFAGTDLGVFEYQNDEWILLKNGMPYSVVYEIEYHPLSGKLLAATYGNGMWELDLKACNIERPVFSHQDTVVLCGEEIIDLEPINYDEKLIYIWQDGSKGSSRTISRAGEYYVSSIDESGCGSTSESIYVLKAEKPDIYFHFSKNVMCNGDTLLVHAGINNYSPGDLEFTWSDGKKGNARLISKPGEYKLTAKSEIGCESDTIRINILASEISNPIIQKKGDELITIEGFEYLWYKDGILLPEESGKKLKIRGSGKYFVKISDEYGCSDSSEVYSVNFNESSGNIKYSVYPNPASESIIIEGEFLEPAALSIYIYDVNGKEISRTQFESNSDYFYKSINISALSAGVYYIAFSVDNRITTHSFIKH